MTDTQELTYNAGMPEKAETMQLLPEADLIKLCKKIEKLKRYNQRQMSELLGVHLKTYQSWRFDQDRDQSGKAIGRLFLLKQMVEEEFGIEIKLDKKPVKQENNQNTQE